MKNGKHAHVHEFLKFSPDDVHPSPANLVKRRTHRSELRRLDRMRQTRVPQRLLVLADPRGNIRSIRRHHLFKRVFLTSDNSSSDTFTPLNAGTYHIQIEYSRVPSSPDTLPHCPNPTFKLCAGGPCVTFDACATDVGSTMDRAGICWGHGREHDRRLEKHQCVWVRGSKFSQRVYPDIERDRAQHFKGTRKRVAYQTVQPPECPIPTML